MFGAASAAGTKPKVQSAALFTGKVESFDVEMDNSSSELVDYFIKQSHR